MGLHKAPLHRSVRIARICDAHTRAQLLRLGITEGSEVVCEQRMPFGPVILRHRHNRLALGRRIARDIHVQVLA
jgi:Fe2+ transport system protein FeoA